MIFDELGRLYVVLQNGGSVNLKSGSAEDSSGDYCYQATLDFDGVFRIYSCHKLQSNGSWSQSSYVPKDICSEIQGDLGVGVVALTVTAFLTRMEGQLVSASRGFPLSIHITSSMVASRT